MSVLWFLEGLSSQRDILVSIKRLLPDVRLIASHRQDRPEITSVADISLTEPTSDDARMAFIHDVLQAHNAAVLHVGRHCRWYESRRREVEAMGVVLVTGARGLSFHDVADDKMAFAEAMAAVGLPATPSIVVTSREELAAAITNHPFDVPNLCIKPVHGIYGMGFWRLDDRADPMASFSNPDARVVNTQVYLSALADAPQQAPLILMPYLLGPECSIDLLVDNGQVIYAIGRLKIGSIQKIINTGPEIELASACAATMQADGLVNVQTRQLPSGEPVLLEINLRPSGGICFSQSCGVSLPAFFALWQLGRMSAEELRRWGDAHFHPVTVRTVTYALPLPSPSGEMFSVSRDMH